MNRHLIFFFLLLSCIFSARADSQPQWLRRPLAYVSPDSVLVWDYTGHDLRTLALRADPGAQAVTFRVADTRRKQRQSLYAEWARIAPTLNAVGGMGDEMGEPQALSGARATDVAARLFLLTGEARFADICERSLFNAVWRTVADTAQAHTLAGAVAATWGASLPGLIYATSGQADLYVNLYLNNTARVTVGTATFTFDQITSMPDRGQVKFRISRLSSPLRLRLHLRMPDWVTGRAPRGLPFLYTEATSALPAVYVNGHELDELETDDAGYLTIDREWRSMDEVYLNFDLTPRLLRRAEAESGTPRRGEVALQRGPWIYALTASAQGCYFSANATLPPVEAVNRYGHTVQALTLYRAGGTPQDAAAEELPFHAEPYADGPTGALWMPEPR